MKKLVDKISCMVALLAVFASGIGTFAFLNVMTRPEMITVAFELPKREGEVIMWDVIGEELPPPPSWYVDYEAEQRSYYNPYVFTNNRSYTPEEYVCMAKNIYFEARHESVKGQLLVALVTLERVEDPRWPNNVCDVVYEHKQFSWYSDGLSDNPKNFKKFEQVALVASAIMHSDTSIIDFTRNANHYHADYVEPKWAENMIRMVKIETHIAYRD